MLIVVDQEFTARYLFDWSVDVLRCYSQARVRSAQREGSCPSLIAERGWGRREYVAGRDAGRAEGIDIPKLSA